MNTLMIYFIFVPILALLLLGLNFLFATVKEDSEKLSPYECGFAPIYGQTRTPFSIHFYVVAILFLVFDLEILLLYPIALTLYQVSIYGFIFVFIFFIFIHIKIIKIIIIVIIIFIF